MPLYVEGNGVESSETKKSQSLLSHGTLTKQKCSNQVQRQQIEEMVRRFRGKTVGSGCPICKASYLSRPVAAFAKVGSTRNSPRLS